MVLAKSARASVVISTRPGTSTSWSIAAAIIRALLRVRCMRSAPHSVHSWSTASSGFSRIADTRGSAEVSGWSSLVTSSDCTVTSENSPTASTTYSMAAAARWARDTSRVDTTLTCLPAGDCQWAGGSASRRAGREPARVRSACRSGRRTAHRRPTSAGSCRW
ncbi:glycoside hydrolase family 65 central catalytic [Mycobacterium kansasii]|uniref:Glycoside hydrolase family 65 central catalytic n=1 Tax=Mycobacterium kansasii TaxID=1768 RepID=A0A1V3WKV4_MYCKA|nr:glycoside hydrolase family 65 central catalytic [Mycobacterium kansasii]